MSRYPLVMGALLLIPVLRDSWPASKALLTMTMSAATHALIDRRWPVRALLRMAGSPGFATVDWGVIAVDCDSCPPGGHSRRGAAVGG